METLKFLFTTRCGNKLVGETDHDGWWDSRKTLRIDIKDRTKRCGSCVKHLEWSDGIVEGELIQYEDWVCPAIGLLISRNGDRINGSS